MVDISLLRDTIEESGLPMTVIAKRSGISREMIYYKLENPNSIKASDVVGFSKALNLNKNMRDKIFLN